jgi:YggT family protein
MLFQIFVLLLQVATGLVAGMCLLRLYLQLQRINLSPFSGNPMTPLIFALTNWIVLPLRRVLPALGCWDTASLVSAFLVLLAKYALLWWATGATLDPANLPIQAVLELVSTAVSGLMWMVIIYAVLSWVQPHSPMMFLLTDMVEPLLHPVRQLVPRMGGLDLSPLWLMVLLQVVEIVLSHLSTLLFV